MRVVLLPRKELSRLSLLLFCVVEFITSCKDGVPLFDVISPAENRLTPLPKLVVKPCANANYYFMAICLFCEEARVLEGN